MKNKILPYGRQTIAQQDIQAVVDVLQSDWLTTGPIVGRFEQAVAQFVDTKYAVAVSNGTAALHSIMHALDIGPGDEVIVPTMTFAATANAVVFCNGIPRFADVDPETLLIDPDSVSRLITPRTKALVGVDYAGQPCNYQILRQICLDHGLALVADACHSLGAGDGVVKCGKLADLSAFSFHPVKPITSGEGGMVVTDDANLANSLRRFRNHGIDTDVRQRQAARGWYYEMVDLGFNYRLTDIQCALGLSQLQRLSEWIKRRNVLAELYLKGLEHNRRIVPLSARDGVTHGYHLFVVRLKDIDRDVVFHRLREMSIGVNVHYVPVHLHPFYRERFGTKAGDCPAAEQAFKEILSLPLFPGMQDEDVKRVLQVLNEVVPC